MKIYYINSKFLTKITVLIVIGIFCLTTIVPPSLAQQALAQPMGVSNLPAPVGLIPLSPAHHPVVLKGIKVDPQNPLQFEFMIDTGDADLNEDDLKTEADKLIKYFLTALTVPEDDLWVNLSPYEKGRILPESFGVTEMGRDLLAQDYLLKQLTASLIYPENGLGNEFWQKVYSQSHEKFGTTDMPMNSFNKVWILPEKSIVYEDNGVAFIGESQLKVMLEKDYLSLKNNLKSDLLGNKASTTDNADQISDVSASVLREMILPQIEKEINEGENFANLRQIYSSLILANWYKERMKGSLLHQIYNDQNRVGGLEAEDKHAKEKIYEQYVETFQKGVYNYTREEYDQYSQEMIPRKYFSGGFKGQVDSQYQGMPILNRIKAGVIGTLMLVVASIAESCTTGSCRMDNVPQLVKQITPTQTQFIDDAIETKAKEALMNDLNLILMDQSGLKLSETDKLAVSMLRALLQNFYWSQIAIAPGVADGFINSGGLYLPESAAKDFKICKLHLLRTLLGPAVREFYKTKQGSSQEKAEIIRLASLIYVKDADIKFEKDTKGIYQSVVDFHGQNFSEEQKKAVIVEAAWQELDQLESIKDQDYLTHLINILAPTTNFLDANVTVGQEISKAKRSMIHRRAGRYNIILDADKTFNVTNVVALKEMLIDKDSKVRGEAFFALLRILVEFQADPNFTKELQAEINSAIKNFDLFEYYKKGDLLHRLWVLAKLEEVFIGFVIWDEANLVVLSIYREFMDKQLLPMIETASPIEQAGILDLVSVYWSQVSIADRAGDSFLRVRKIIAEALKQKNTLTRFAAINAVGADEPLLRTSEVFKETVSELFKATQDTNPLIRAAAIERLARLGPDIASPEESKVYTQILTRIAELWKEADPIVRKKTAFTLDISFEDLQSIEAMETKDGINQTFIDQLIKQVTASKNDREKNLRILSVIGILNGKNQDLLKQIIEISRQATEDDDYMVRGQAFENIKTLLHLLNDADYLEETMIPFLIALRNDKRSQNQAKGISTSAETIAPFLLTAYRLGVLHPERRNFFHSVGARTIEILEQYVPYKALREISNDNYFKNKTGGLDANAQYALARGMLDNLKRIQAKVKPELAKEVTFAKVGQRLLDKMLEKRETFSKKNPFKEKKKLGIISHDEPGAAFDPDNIIELIKKDDDLKNLDITKFKGPGDKDKVLDFIKNAEANTAFWFTAHGGPAHIWLSQGEPGSQVSLDKRNPLAISDVEIVESLLILADRFQGDLSSFLIVVDSCHAGACMDAIVDQLQQAFVDKRITKMPRIITSTSEVTGIKLGMHKALKSTIKDRFLGQAFFDADEIILVYQDFQVYDELTEDDIMDILQVRREALNGGGQMIKIGFVNQNLIGLPVEVAVVFDQKQAWEKNVAEDRLGGVDFRRSNMDLGIKLLGQPTSFTIDLPKFENPQIKGLYPVIRNITPIINLPAPMGSSLGKGDQQLSQLNRGKKYEH